MSVASRSFPLSVLLVAALSACAPTQQNATPAATPVAAGSGAVQEGAAPQTASEASSAVADNGDEMICKKYDVTGSHIAKRKVCMTRHQWEVYSQRTQDEYQRAAERRGSSQPGGQVLPTR